MGLLRMQRLFQSYQTSEANKKSKNTILNITYRPLDADLNVFEKYFKNSMKT